MEKKYRLVEVGEKHNEWDDFVRTSKQGTIFSLSKYLSATGKKYARYFIYKGNEIKAGLSLVLSEDGKNGVLDDLVIYNGLIFRADMLQREVKARQERFEITEFVVGNLCHRFTSVEMALHPSCEDMRPFLWHNYHEVDQGRHCRLDLRYTSFLDISEFFLQRPEETMTLYKNLDNIRQSDIRKARKEGVSVREDACCVALFIRFYSDLIASQGKSVDEKKLMRMRTLIESLLSDNMAKLFVATSKDSGQVSYITIFTFFENSACYLFGAGDASAMTRYDGTICLWDAFRLLSSYGIHEVDMEGINSPLRGAFKLSFGGNIQSYYHVSWNGEVDGVKEKMANEE